MVPKLLYVHTCNIISQVQTAMSVLVASLKIGVDIKRHYINITVLAGQPLLLLSLNCFTARKPYFH